MKVNQIEFGLYAKRHKYIWRIDKQLETWSQPVEFVLWAPEGIMEIPKDPDERVATFDILSKIGNISTFDAESKYPWCLKRWSSRFSGGKIQMEVDITSTSFEASRAGTGSLREELNPLLKQLSALTGGYVRPDCA